MGQFLGRGQMQVGKHDLVFANQVVLGRQGLFYVHHHVGFFKDLGRGGDQFGPGRGVLFIGKAAAGAGIFFD